METVQRVATLEADNADLRDRVAWLEAQAVFAEATWQSRVCAMIERADALMDRIAGRFLDD